VSLVDASAALLIVQDPTGSITGKTLSLPGSGQVFTYTTLAADFTVAGRYLLALRVDWGATKRLRSKPLAFNVDGVPEDPS
jgi:hypothetical protein